MDDKKKFFFDGVNQDFVYLNSEMLSIDENKALEKLEMLGLETDVFSLLELDESTSLRGVGARYWQYIKNIKRKINENIDTSGGLNFKSGLYSKNVDSIIDADSFVNVSIYDEKVMAYISLGKEGAKSIEKIVRHGFGCDIKTILHFEPAIVSHVSGFGKAFWEGLAGVKKDIISFLESPEGRYLHNFEEILYTAHTASSLIEKNYFNEIRLNHADLNRQERKVLDKLQRHGFSVDVCSLFFWDSNNVNDIQGLGAGYNKVILSIRRRIRLEVEKALSGEIDINQWESKLLIPAKAELLTLNQLDNYLLEDIDRFLDNLSENELDIIQKRWGFTGEQETLEEIAQTRTPKITRERVRQIEKKLNDQFLSALRFSSDFVWNIIEPELLGDIRIKLSGLHSCFCSDKCFYELIRIMCGQDSLKKYLEFPIESRILENYFAENGGPASIESIKDYILLNSKIQIFEINSVLSNLEKMGHIFIEKSLVWPRKLSKPYAAAFALANHPRGLPWLDLAKVINHSQVSTSAFSLERPEQTINRLQEYVYLCGLGSYRHTRFIDFDVINIESIFDELLVYATDNNRDTFHLNECYASSRVLKCHDYYVIRYIVKVYANDFGFFFDGKSQSDSVGMERNFKNVTQKDVVFESLKKSGRPMTKAEIASLLKSRSLAHAAIYLDEMMQTNKVVQIDRMLYTIPEVAYVNVDVDNILLNMNFILNSEGRPVEASILEVMLNSKLDLSYSKFFYSSLARLHLDKYGWFRRNNIYSTKPIEFKNLSDAVQLYCSRDSSIESNLKVLSQHISLTRDVAVVALQRWRLQRD